MRQSNKHIDTSGGSFITDYLNNRKLVRRNSFHGEEGLRLIDQRNRVINNSLPSSFFKKVGSKILSKFSGGGLDFYETKNNINMRNHPENLHRENNLNLSFI